MSVGKSMIWLVVLLAVSVVLVLPVAVESQCVVATTKPPTSTTTMGSPAYRVIKYLSGTFNCHTTMMNADFCSPDATANVHTLFGTALTMTANPSCVWSCTCGTGTGAIVTIDGSNGLPVELMDFSIED